MRLLGTAIITIKLFSIFLKYHFINSILSFISQLSIINMPTCFGTLPLPSPGLIILIFDDGRSSLLKHVGAFLVEKKKKKKEMVKTNYHL